MKKLSMLAIIYGLLLIAQVFAGRVTLIEWYQCWW